MGEGWGEGYRFVGCKIPPAFGHPLKKGGQFFPIKTLCAALVPLSVGGEYCVFFKLRGVKVCYGVTVLRVMG